MIDTPLYHEAPRSKAAGYSAKENKKILAPPRGFALIATTIITAVLLTLAANIIGSSLSELRIAQAHASATRSYYLAEGASMLLVREIRTDEALNAAFINGTLTRDNSLREYQNVFEENETLSAYAVSGTEGEANIIAAGTSPFGGQSAARTTDTAIARALGSAITDYAIFSGSGGSNLDLRLNLDLIGGIVFANDDIVVQNNARVQARGGGRFHAHDEIRVATGSALVGPIREGVERISMPAIDFDSPLDSSWRNRASRILSRNEFDDLPDGTVLEGIIFVNGSPRDLQKTLTVRGLLIISGNFEIEAPGHLYIEAQDGEPAGLLVRGDLEIENSSSIEGLVYATAEVEIEYDDDDTEGALEVNIHGGVMAREVVFDRDEEGEATIEIIHDANLLRRILNDDQNLIAPTIDIGHWEETY